MKGRRLETLAVFLIVAASTSGGGAQTPAPPGTASADIASVEMGGRVEWVTAPGRASAATPVIANAKASGWSAAPTFPQEIVLSFFSRQPALVAGVEINPTSQTSLGSSKEIEVWTSMQSATEGFTQAGTAVLANEDRLQAVTFPPVEAKFVKLRILSSYYSGQQTVIGRVRVLEGRRDGYQPMLARNPALEAALKGSIPKAPPPVGPGAPAGALPACGAPQPPGRSRFPQSRRVLIVEGSQDVQRPFVQDASSLKDAHLDKPAVGGITLRLVQPEAVAPAVLVEEPAIDTVVLGQVCDTNRMSKEFKRILPAWVAEGHKLIIQDSDVCRQSPDYSFLPYPFKTVNPGSGGARGVAGVLEDSALASANKGNPSFLDMERWKNGQNDLGDSNVMAEWDPRWCGAMWAKNKLQKSGFSLAYAHHGRGLIIYDGIDFDQAAVDHYRQLVAQELRHPFDPDYLSCSNPVGSFTITTGNELKSQPMAPGATYTYPLEVLGNFGYSGKVTLEATVAPADPGTTVALSTSVADLTATDEAATTLTVTAAPAASVTGKVITVRGRDPKGNTGLACLYLPERTTGGLTISSGLRRDRKPTKALEIILDASGSMKALLGTRTRWATAQQVLAEVVAKLPADYQVGLRTYGHREPSTSPKTCADTELVVPVGPLDRARLIAAAKQLRPRGETPLVYSALQTAGDLKSSQGGIVVLITDGEESCKGDFASAAKTLKDSGLDVMLNIVGFTLTNVKAQAELKALAESTGGRYYGAQSGAQLSRALLLAAVDQIPYRVLDAKGNQAATGTAGLDGKHELPPGAYSVVLTAGDESLKVPVTLALRQDVALRVVIKEDRLAVEQ